MKVEFKKSFLKELKLLKNKKLKDSIYECIRKVEAAENISQRWLLHATLLELQTQYYYKLQISLRSKSIIIVL